MYHFSLILAIIFEIGGTICMKYSAGGSKIIPTIGLIVLYVMSLITLAYATKKIELSVAYSIWCGGAIIGITLIDYFYFQAHLNQLKIALLSLIFIGIVGLYIFDGEG